MMAVVPNQPKTPVRTFRIPDEVYVAAKAKAEREGESLSDVVRRLLEEYAAINRTRAPSDALYRVPGNAKQPRPPEGERGCRPGDRGQSL